ncbi:MAG: PAS domain-containing protein [Campylobacterota bacterium]|nr:PAS domain-containing protein [Campylobacterota bacterium]
MSKNKITPRDEEKKLNQDDFIVSKTDTKGIITYCNQIFMEMAEYDESELIGKNHNLVRHPDMPKAAFKLAWDLIQSGKEFFGFVKNLRKHGGYYWVFTNITADYDEKGNIVGYTSVRRKANQSAIDAIEPIYRQMVSLENSGGVHKSVDFLMDFLAQNNTTYDQLVLSLQGDI